MGREADARQRRLSRQVSPANLLQPPIYVRVHPRDEERRDRVDVELVPPGSAGECGIEGSASGQPELLRSDAALATTRRINVGLKTIDFLDSLCLC